jgi:hypothetical protein
MAEADSGSSKNPNETSQPALKQADNVTVN